MKILGIDIGGTRIKAILWDGKILKSQFVLTPKNKQKFISTVENLIKEYSAESFDGIAIGFAGVIDAKAQKVVSAQHIQYLNGFDLAKFVSKFTKNFSIGNDADCALLAEMKSGAMQGKQSGVLIAFGTGIGSGIMIHGQRYRGQGCAGEIGFTILDNGKTAEQLIGGTTLKNFGSQEYKRVAKYGAQLIANVINTLNPEVVVLTGGVIHHAPKTFLPDLKRQIPGYIHSPYAKKTPVLVSKHGVHSIALGAVAMLESLQ